MGGRTQHLNYTRQFLGEWREAVASDVNWPENLRTYIAELKRAYVIAESAVKFELPENGIALSDYTFRAIPNGGIGAVLPFPDIALEYHRPKPQEMSNAETFGTKCIVLARQFADNGEIIVTDICYDEVNKNWMSSGSAIIDTAGEWIHQNNGNGVEFGLRPIDSHESHFNQNAVLQSVAVLASVLNALACANVTTRISKNTIRQKLDELPYDDYRVLTFTPHKETSGDSRGGRRDVVRIPREHVRRGHVRRLSEMKHVWVSSCVVSAGARNKLWKKYRLSPPLSGPP
jgi:hypothetical protein